MKKSPTPAEMIGMIVIGVILTVLLFQSERMWDMLEQLIKVQTTINIYLENK